MRFSRRGLIVIVVVFLFLGNFRASLIPTLAVPVSLIGTFAGLWLFGFSINTLTMFGMVLAIGLLVDDGVLSLDAKVVDFFPGQCPTPISQHLAAMTVRDLLTMRTGHRQGISGGAWRGRSESWVRLFLNEPVEDPPGQRFIYSSASSFMLSAIVSVVSGQTAFELCNARIFQPMGMGRIDWDLAPGGYNTGGNGLSCSTEDLLKFGVLHLQQGSWEGQQLLSREWVAEAATIDSAPSGARPPAMAVPISRPVPKPEERVCVGNCRLRNEPCGANIIGARTPVPTPIAM
mgnify:CR=1 FL=1